MSLGLGTSGAAVAEALPVLTSAALSLAQRLTREAGRHSARGHHPAAP